MKLLIVLALLAVAVAARYSSLGDSHSRSRFGGGQILKGAAYQSLSAKDKLDLIWKKLLADTTPASFFGAVTLGKIFLYDVTKTMSTVADDMPSDLIPGVQRDKLVHTVGGVAKAKFVSNGKHSYTGVFKGANNVIIRFSLAAKPEESKITPGLGMKFLISGRPSVNAMVMHSVLGQSSWNPFEKTFSNIISALPSSAPIPFKLLDKKFRSASNWANMLSVHQLSEYEENGKAESRPKFPFAILLKPSDKVKNMFTSNYEGQDLNDMLSSIPAQVLYQVYAKASPKAPEEHIGHLEMITRFTPSNFGDKKLFFQHVKIEKSFEIHPEWMAEGKGLGIGLDNFDDDDD